MLLIPIIYLAIRCFPMSKKRTKIRNLIGNMYADLLRNVLIYLTFTEKIFIVYSKKYILDVTNKNISGGLK